MQKRAFSRSRWRNDRNHLSCAQTQICIGQNFQILFSCAVSLLQPARFQQGCRRFFVPGVLFRTHGDRVPSLAGPRVHTIRTTWCPNFLVAPFTTLDAFRRPCSIPSRQTCVKTRSFVSTKPNTFPIFRPAVPREVRP